jgi:sulfate permease, SulP family
VPGRIPGTRQFGDRTRHPENAPLPCVPAVRPEGALIYLGAEQLEEAVMAAVEAAPAGTLHAVVCDLSAIRTWAPRAFTRCGGCTGALVARGIALRLVGAHGRIREFLKRDGVAELAGGGERRTTMEAFAAELERQRVH